MARCAKSANGCEFIRRRSAASYRQQVARASDSEACSDKTSSVASRTADHLEVIGLKATPKIADFAPIEWCLCNLRCCMTISIDWVQRTYCKLISCGSQPRRSVSVGSRCHVSPRRGGRWGNGAPGATRGPLTHQHPNNGRKGPEIVAVNEDSLLNHGLLVRMYWIVQRRHEPTQCAELTANLSAGFFSASSLFFGTPPKPSRYRAKPQWYRVIHACNN